MFPRKYSIGVFIPEMNPGGAQAVTAWILDSLAKAGLKVDLLSFNAPDCDEIDSWFGTDCKQLGVCSKKVPLPIGMNVKRLAKLPVNLQHYLFNRCASKLFPNYDLLVSGYNEMDFKHRPAIQYIHFPLFGAGANRVLTAGGFKAKDSLIKKIYRRVVAFCLGFNSQSALEGVLVTNSEWTANVVEEAYQIKPQVVYPPVVATKLATGSWMNKELSFFAMGRLVPDKKWEQILSILDRLHNAGYKFKFDLVCGQYPDTDYTRSILQRLSESQYKFQVHVSPSRAEIEQILARAKFGIHAMENEHFGMVVAEMLRGGVLPIVPQSGGQMEIVNHYQELMYGNIDEAVAKISYLIENEIESQLIVNHLRKRASRFDATVFCAAIQDLARQQLKYNQPETQLVPRQPTIKPQKPRVAINTRTKSVPVQFSGRS